MVRKVVKNKMGQMKIQQMAFMLIAVTLFFVFVVMFLLTIVFSNVKRSAESVQEENAMLLVSKLANSPEFSCGNSFGGARINCLDMDKIMAVQSHMRDYSNFWNVKKIEIREIYPLENKVECSLENYPNCGFISLGDTNDGIGVSNFVALCHKGELDGLTQDVCKLGRLIVYY